MISRPVSLSSTLGRDTLMDLADQMLLDVSGSCEYSVCQCIQWFYVDEASTSVKKKVSYSQKKRISVKKSQGKVNFF